MPASTGPKTSQPGWTQTFRTILTAMGSHVAAKVAGKYGMGCGDPLVVSGAGSLYPIMLVYLDAADYPCPIDEKPRLRIRAVLSVNDVAPTGNFTVGLYPVTRPATSGGAALNIYTLGTLVPGSGVTVNTPAADSMNNLVGAEFDLPANGFYCIGVTTTATVATASLVHTVAQLQQRNSF